MNGTITKPAVKSSTLWCVASGVLAIAAELFLSYQNNGQISNGELITAAGALISFAKVAIERKKGFRLPIKGLL